MAEQRECGFNVKYFVLVGLGPEVGKFVSVTVAQGHIVDMYTALVGGYPRLLWHGIGAALVSMSFDHMSWWMGGHVHLVISARVTPALGHWPKEAVTKVLAMVECYMFCS